MNHQRERELLALSLYDELSPEEKTQLDAHLSRCAECAAFAAELRATIEPLRALERERSDDLPRGWSENLRGLTRTERAGSTFRLPFRGARLLPFAAGLAAGLLLALALRGPTGPGIEEAPPTRVARSLAPPFVELSSPPPRATSRPPLAALQALRSR